MRFFILFMLWGFLSFLAAPFPMQASAVTASEWYDVKIAPVKTLSSPALNTHGHETVEIPHERILPNAGHFHFPAGISLRTLTYTGLLMPDVQERPSYPRTTYNYRFIFNCLYPKHVFW